MLKTNRKSGRTDGQLTPFCGDADWGFGGGEKILWGIYSVEKGEWLADYAVDENESIFFDGEVLAKAPYSSPNTSILVCPMEVKDGRRSFTI